MSARKPETPRLKHRAGLTLIETLLAMAIAALVVVLVFSTYHTATRTLAGQETRRQGRFAAVHALNMMARDLTCGVTGEGGDGCQLLLTRDPAGPDASSELSFCCAGEPDPDDVRWYAIRQTTYRVIEPKAGLRQLVRETQPLVGPGANAPPRTNIIVKAVAGFHATAFDGEAWVEEWPGKESGPWPRAVRIQVAMGGGGSATALTTQVYIPIANVITSSLERSGHAAR